MAMPVIDKNNPWPWLDPFTEKAQAFFNGRDAESAALERCVASASATVLFGKSGLGKTSLLQAGLFPRLRQAGWLPVLVRLAYGGKAPPCAAQIRLRLHQECSAHGLTIPGTPQLAPQLEAEEDRLWLDLHTRPLGLGEAGGRNWQPVLVLDQFEEIFTVGGQDGARQLRDFCALGDLVENRIPSALESAIRADEDLLDVLQLDAQPYRVVVSLREDYLPNLERWCDRIPRLGPNRYRLLPMQEAQGLEAILLTGGDLVSPDDAQRIVHFVASQQEGPAVGMASGECVEVSIEPALLSLLCSGLNLERQSAGAARLDAANLEQRGGRIMERFYADAVDGVAPTAVAFLEDELITPDGVRLFYPLKSILENPVVTRTDIDTLIERRLLRRQPFVDGDRIEVVHDRLAAVARQRRASREGAARQQRLLEEAHREAAVKEANVRAQLESHARQIESEARERAERDAELLRHLQRRLKQRFAALVVLLVITGFLAVLAKQQAGYARRAEDQATLLRLVAEGRAMSTGQQSGDPLLGMLRMLAVHRLLAQRFPEASPAAFGALQAEFLRHARLVRVIENDEAIHCLALSPDRSRLVSGSGKGRLRLWDVATGKPLAESFEAHAGAATSLAFSPDGRRFVSAGRDGKLRFWDAASRAPLGEPLEGHRGPVSSVAFSPDGTRLVSASADMTLLIRDAVTGSPVGKPLLGHQDAVTSVAFSADGRRIVSASRDGKLRLWQASSGSPLDVRFAGHSEAVYSVAFSPDGKRIVSAGGDLVLRVWDAASGARVGEPLAGHSDIVKSVAFSPDGSQIVSGGRDASVRLWVNGADKPGAERLGGHLQEVTGVAFSEDGKLIVSGSLDKTLFVWKASADGTESEVFGGPSKPVMSVAFSPDGKTVAAGGKDHTVFLWDVATGARIGKRLEGHSKTVYSVAFSPDGKRLVSGSEDTTLRLWKVASGETVGMLAGHTGTVYSAVFSPDPDGRRIASASFDTTLRLWDATTQAAIAKPIESGADIVYGAAFSPDGKQLVSAGGETLQIWDVATGARVGEPLDGHERTVTSVAFSTDGKRIVSGSDDRTVRLWDGVTGKPVGEPFKGHTDYINSVAFSPDPPGRYVVSGGRDATLRLWDSASGDPVGVPLVGHQDSIYSVVFSPDGKYLASGSEDATVRRWPVLESWADALCAKLPRNLTRAEWRRLIPPHFDYAAQCPKLPLPAD